MTRKLLTALVLMLIGVGQAQSNPVGRQDAMKKAQEFLQSKGKSFAASSVRRVPSNQPDDDYQPYYLFNVGNREGFVVAAGDDRVPAILGYADDGMLLPDSLPSNMKAWLELYEQQIRYIQENDIDVSSALFASNHPKISPLLTTTWDQTDPYNQSCPDFFTYGKCVTGCVATAMAQVMFYHRDNSVTKTQKTIPAYTCRTKWSFDGGTQQVQVNAVPAGSVIDWDNMLNSYSSSATTTQKKAVADLMFYCGASVSMNYANDVNGGSGAYSSDVPAALKTYFDYSDNTQMASRSSYSSDEAWDNLIYNELSQQRPVLYTGATSSGAGHAFVCDGYDGNGYYHINWGWGSYCDGNFLLTNLTPEDQGTGGSSGGYNNNQTALIGAVPNGGSTPPVGTSVVLNATNFPDAKFRAYISNLTGVAEGGTLSEEKLKSVTSIDVSGTYSANGGITSLKGVEHFTALTYLKCHNNHLTSLDVSHNTALTTLYCYSNQLTSLDVSQNTALTVLHCYYNQLPSLDVSQNTALAMLVCEGNQLSSLDVSHNTALTTLSCWSNQLTSLDVSHNTALKYLYCYNNQLTSLDVSHNTALTELKCYNNQLMSLDVSHNTALITLYCSSNQLSSLDVSHNTALTSLSCSINQLSSLDVSQNTALTELYCQGNQLTSLDLSKCTKLTSTSVSSQSKSVVASSLGSNQYSIDVPADFNLSKVSSFTVNSVSVTPTLSNGKLQFTSSTVPTSVTYQYNTDNSFAGNMMVTVTVTSIEEASGIVLNATNFPDAKFRAYISNKTGVAEGGTLSEEKLKSVTSIDVSGTPSANGGITSLKGVEHFTALKYLYCDFNQLPSLDVSHNTALTKLSCWSNQLPSLDVSHNTALKELRCNNNQLTSLDVSHNTALTRLECYINQLSSLDVSHNTALKYLYCHHNQLPSLDVSHNTALISLSCGSNKLSTLDVSHNTALTELECYSIQLPSLDVSHNTALTKLSCWSNQLPSLDVSHNTALAELECYSNQLPSLDVSHNTALTKLSCGSNQLPSLDVTQNTALTSLSCGSNQLPSLDVSHNTVLTELYCDNNQLPSLDVSHNTALTWLQCSGNQLTSLDVSHNTALTTLWCYSNQLPSLDVSHNTALTSLVCYNNQLSSLDVSHNTALYWLYCYSNQLMSLDLSKCTKLELTSTLVSSQSKSVVASSLGSNQYSIDVPADLYLSKVSSFIVNSVSVTPTLSNGKLQFTSSAVPTSVTYQYNTDNSVAGNMKVTVTVTSIEEASGIVLNATNFPDAKFRAYISDITGVAEGGTLSEEKLKSVTSIDVSGTSSANGGITSLKGVEHFTALTQLSCAYNQLSSLDVSHNTALTTLYCYSNQLTSLDVSGATALEYLSCYSNQLTSLDVSHNTALTKLYCSGNQLTSLDVSHNTALTELNCRSNQLSSLDVSGATALTVLYCYRNQLSSLDVSGATALTVLYCYNNQLTSLDVSGATALTWLHCYSNQLTSLDVSHNTALTELWCYGNLLSSLDVSGATVLTVLNCGGNQLSSLDVSQNTALTRLKCYINHLTSLDVSHNTALKELECSRNQLTSLDVSHNTALKDLSCSSNQLSSLDVSHNTALTELSCSSNQLPSLDVSHNTALTELYCHNNQLPSLDVSHNTALTRLECNSNQLTSLDVSHNTALTGLYCDNNQLTSLDVSHNTALTELRCYNNQLSSLDVSHNTALTTLKCYNNQLMSLDLSKCTKLQLGAEYYSTSVSSQSKSVVASSLGSNEYSIDVSADFNLSKVSSFTVNSVSVTPTLSNGKLQFTSSAVPTSVTYQYNTDNSVVGNMSVTVDIMAIEDVVPANTVYMDDMEVMTGMEETLSVKMKNEVPMEGFEFDLYVPEGVTVATDGDGFPEVYLSTERTTARKTNSFDAIFLPDGGVRVLAASTNGSAISGNDGEVVTVKVNIGADMAEGDYTVLLKNIALSGTDAVSHPTEQMSSTLHVTYGILGDANRDKRVDVADFTTTAHHILGKNPDPFNDKAANANRDERIDVGDLTAIAHIILYGSVDKPTNGANGLPRRAPATDSGEQGGEGYPTNYVYINPVSAESGTEQTLSVKMKNAVDAEGFEFDLYLPEGMSFVLDADGFPEATLSTERTTTRKTNSFDAVIQPDGALRVLAASTNGSVISGHDGEVAQVKVRIDGDVPTGTYLLTLKEIAVSDVDCVSHRTDELVSDITVESGSPTSLDGVVTDGDDDNTYYNMSGQRINKPTRSGVYIQRGKKVVVK